MTDKHRNLLWVLALASCLVATGLWSQSPGTMVRETMVSQAMAQSDGSPDGSSNGQDESSNTPSWSPELYPENFDGCA